MGSKYRRHSINQLFQNYQWLVIAVAVGFGFFLGYMQFSQGIFDDKQQEDKSLSLLSIDELCEGHIDDELVIPDNFDFFQWHQAYWEKHVLPHMQNVVKSQGYVRVLELGIMAGSSTKWLLENMIAPYPGSSYIGVDDFQIPFRGPFCKNLARSPLSQEPMMMNSMTLPAMIEIAGHVYQFRDKRSLRFGNRKLFDFIFVDDGHSGSEVYVHNDTFVTNCTVGPCSRLVTAEERWNDGSG